MTSWLSKHKKAELLELSREAGLRQTGDLLKDELVENLDGFLQQNATRLSRNSLFDPYYHARRTPFRARSSSATALPSGDDAEVKSVVKARGRRTTQVKQEDEDDHVAPSGSRAATTPSSALTTRTPGRIVRSGLPASPADVADEMELASRRMSASIDNIYTASKIPDVVEHVRQICSSVIGVQMTFLLLEGYALSRHLLPMSRVGPVFWPGFRFLGLQIPDTAVYLPDLFRLLTADFWYPALLWSSTSIIIPLLFAYFYNLSIREFKRGGVRMQVMRYQADPMTFNIVKALAALIVYNQDHTLGFIDPVSVYRINHAVYGGSRGMLIGGYIGILASLYDAAQRK